MSEADIPRTRPRMNDRIDIPESDFLPSGRLEGSMGGSGLEELGFGGFQSAGDEDHPSLDPEDSGVPGRRPLASEDVVVADMASRELKTKHE